MISIINVVLSVIIAILNVGVSSANNQMPTMDFSTPEQPPGDTRRKVSGFLGCGTVAVAWSWCLEVHVYASAALLSLI